MGLHDRTYWREEQHGGFGGGGGITLSFPKPGRMIRALLLANIAAFVVQIFLDQGTIAQPVGPVSRHLGVTVAGYWQIWRYVTFQFLHTGAWHLALNMMGLYFLGVSLERKWGPRQFLVFYLTCGVAAGVAYVVIGASYGLPVDLPIVGASGGVYGVVLACAVFFPQIRLLLFFIIPMSIRTLAVIFFGLMILTVLQAVSGGNFNEAMSDVAHMGGAAAAAVWIWLLPKALGGVIEARKRRGAGAWQRKMQRRAAEEAEIDRILAKIRRDGLNSITGKEREILRNATRKQQEEDNKLYR